MRVEDVDFEGVNRLLDTWGLRSIATAVVASGSIIRGWGHSLSDLDLYVVLPDAAAPHAAAVRFVDEYSHLSDIRVPVAVDWVDGLKVDVEIWTEGQLEELVRLMKDSTASTNWQLIAPEKYFDTLYRFSIGLALRGDEWVGRFQRRLRDAEVAKLACRQALNDADAYLEDAVGFIRSGRGDLAALTAHHAYGRVIDGLVALAGEYQPGYKWRPLRVRETEVVPYDDYWAVETMAGLEAGKELSWATATVRSARSMFGTVAL